MPVESLEARLAGLPEGETVEAGRIEVRFAGAKEAVVKLFALAQALTGDYERFEELVGKGGEVGMSEALVPAPSAGRVEIEPPGSAAVALPAVIVDAGPAAVERFLEFFAPAIANGRTRAAYGRAVGQFLAWCSSRGLTLRAIAPLHVAAYIRTHPGLAPTVKQHLAAIRALCDWLVVHHQVLPVDPARVGPGPEARRQQGRDARAHAGRDAGAPRPDRHGDGGGAARSGAAERDGVQLCAGERGGGDAPPGLAAAGFSPSPADGVFGPATRAAIRGWQVSRGATATGYLDAAGAGALGASLPAATVAPSVAVSAPALSPAEATRAEVVFWESMRDSTDPADFDEHLARWPAGLFARWQRTGWRCCASRRVSPPLGIRLGGGNRETCSGTARRARSWWWFRRGGFGWGACRAGTARTTNGRCTRWRWPRSRWACTR